MLADSSEDAEHKMALGGLEKKELRGMDANVFASAPKHVALHTLQYIRHALQPLSMTSVHWAQ